MQNNTMKKAAAPLMAAMLALGALSGCATGLGGSDYARGEARRTMTVRMGVVEGVRPVQLEGTRSPVGTLAGAAVGGVAGSTVGQGKGAGIAAVLGAVAGGLAGSALEQGVTKKPGVEVTVRLNNGEYLAVVQEDQGENFQPGERVRLLQDGQTTRVTR